MQTEQLEALQAKLIKLEEDNKALREKTALTGPVPRIMIGVPILAWTHEFALSFLNFWTELMTYQHKGKRFEVCYNFKYRRPVQLAEEELAEAAIDAGCTHLLLMDDDILDVTVANFLSLLEADKDVIGGIMHTGGFPYAICAFRRFDQNTKVIDQPSMTQSTRLYEVPVEQRVGVQMVDLIPFAFTLIKTSVFKNLPKPWFTCDTKAPTDSYFADSILTANMQYYAHFDVWLNHKGVTKDNVQFYAQLGMHETQKKNKGRIVELSPEDMHKQEVMVQAKMKQAEASFKDEEVRRLKFYERKEGVPIGAPVVAEPPKQEVVQP